MRRTSTDLQSGVTLVELVVVLTILGIVIGLVLMTLGNFYLDNTRTLSTTLQTGDTHNSLRTIEKDVRNAERFLTANAITDPAAGSQWSYSGSDASHRTLILSTYATTIPASGDAAGARSLLMSGGLCDQPMTNNLVYFISGTNLYRRTIANTTAACGGLTNGYKQSCAPGTSGAFCQATDALILTNIDELKVDYYASSTAASPIGNQYQSGAETTVEAATLKTIKVTIRTKQKINGVDSLQSTNLRMTRRN